MWEEEKAHCTIDRLQWYLTMRGGRSVADVTFTTPTRCRPEDRRNRYKVRQMRIRGNRNVCLGNLCPDKSTT